MKKVIALLVSLTLNATANVAEQSICSNSHFDDKEIASICNANGFNDDEIYYVRLSHGVMPIPDSFILDTRVADYYLLKTYGSHNEDVMDANYRSLHIRDGDILEQLDTERIENVEGDRVAERLIDKCGINTAVYKYSSPRTDSRPEVAVLIYNMEKQSLSVDLRDAELLRAMLVSFVRLNCL